MLMEIGALNLKNQTLVIPAGITRDGCGFVFVNNPASSQPEIKQFYYLLSPQEKEGEINMDLLQVCLLEG